MADNEINIVVDVDDKASNKLNAIGELGGKIAGIATQAFQSFSGAITDVGQQLGKAGTQMASTAASGATMAGSMTVATGGLNLLAGAVVGVAALIPALIGGFLSLAPALSIVGGLAGAAATALAGVGVVGGVLKLGLGGLGEAWDAYGKKAGGGGGASKSAGDQAYQAARRVEQAERALADAKRAQTKASQDISKAYADERERIEDLTLALRGQEYAQEDANDALKEALEKQKWAAMYGDAGQREAADKAVKRAQYRYDYETERLKDLQDEKADSDRKGISGSDQVQAALERERQAAEQVRVAQENLADAKRKTETASVGAAGGVNQFADAMSKLSPNARKLINTLIDLKDRFTSLKLAVQDRLLAGFDVAIKDLADKWAPRLLPMLGGMADKLNEVGKGLLKAFGDTTFMDNIQKASKAFEGFLGHLGEAGESLIDAFGRLAGASGPVLEELGSIIEDIADSFDRWIKAAEDSGGLETFMENAAGYLRQIYDIGKLVVAIIGDFIEILFPSSDEIGGSFLDGVQEVLTNIHEYLKDPKNQKTIREWIEKFKDFFNQLVTKWIPAAIDFANNINSIITRIRRWVNVAKEIYHVIHDNLPAAFKVLKGVATGLFDPIKNSFKAAINWIIDKWNNFHLTIGGGTFLGMDVPSFTLETINIKPLATGGISGAGLTMMNERGPELVKLPTGSQVYSAGDSARMAGQGGGQPIVVQLILDGKVLVEKTVEPMRRFVADRFGGNVQRAYGQTS